MTAISVSERLLEMAAFYTPLALTVTLQTPFPELHAQKKSRLICLTIGRVDRTMFLKGTIVTNQAAHGMVTHQAAPRLILGI